jgi:hypothetical protein
VCGSVFNDVHKNNVRALLDALGSNLDAWNPVQFAWNKNDMVRLYAKGPYVAHAPEPVSTVPLADNLYDDVHVLETVRRERPDGLRNPELFQQAIEDGLIDLQTVENVQACVLAVGKFYLQRPAVLGTPFDLVRVMRVHLSEDGKTQEGAWVHPWEVSTTGSDVDYFYDPWHASALYKGSQRYDSNKPMSAQGANWTYPLSMLCEFQDEVKMNATWNKKRDFTKQLSCKRGVLKRSIAKINIPKVRYYTHRWNEDEERLDHDEQADEDDLFSLASMMPGV